MNKVSGVIWLTGLSASGKSTLTEMIKDELQNKGITPVVLDGDQIRAAIDDPHWLYDSESRLKGSYRYSRLAKLFADQGHLVLVPTISMFDSVRDWNRTNIAHYLEVYIQLSQALRTERDTKGVYREVDSSQVVGAEPSVELPKNSDVQIDNSGSQQQLNQHAIKIVEQFISTQQ